jgi:hypothetical protein
MSHNDWDILRTKHNSIFIADYIIDANILITVDLTHNLYLSIILDKILEWLDINKYLPKIYFDHSFANKKEIIWEITFGGDPEFELIENGEVVHASYANRYIGFCKGLYSEIGTDGSENQIELRPIPDNNINKLIDNIKILFRKIDNMKIKLSTKGDIYPLGGHIHIGLKNNNKINLSYSGILKIIKLFDYFIGIKTLKISGNGRGRYACKSSIKTKVYANKINGFEYRTPPSSIFTCPRICKTTFEICNIIISKLLNNESISISNNPDCRLKDLVNLGIPIKEAIEFIKFIYKVRKKMNYNDNIVDFWLDKEKENEFLKLKTNSKEALECVE